MVARARGFTKDPTTSFPSRAVTCGLVYSATICFCYVLTHASHGGSGYVESWMFPPVVGVTLASAWARMALGAHYPSDCIAGVLQGMLILTAALSLYYLESYGCGSCADDTCYSSIRTFNVYSSNMPVANAVVGVCFSVLGVAVVFTAQQEPLLFWDKCHYVYGLLLPAVAFRLLFLCPRLQQHWWGGGDLEDGDRRLYALPPPLRDASTGDWFWSVALTGALLVLIWLSRRWKSRLAKLACFILIYIWVAGTRLLRRTPAFGAFFTADFVRVVEPGRG